MRNNVNYQEVVCDQCRKTIRESFEARAGQTVNNLAGWIYLQKIPRRMENGEM